MFGLRALRERVESLVMLFAGHEDRFNDAAAEREAAFKSLTNSHGKHSQSAARLTELEGLVDGMLAEGVSPAALKGWIIEAFERRDVVVKKSEKARKVLRADLARVKTLTDRVVERLAESEASLEALTAEKSNHSSGVMNTLAGEISQLRSEVLVANSDIRGELVNLVRRQIQHEMRDFADSLEGFESRIKELERRPVMKPPVKKRPKKDVKPTSLVERVDI